MGSVHGLGLEVFELAPVGVAVTSGPEHRLVYTNAAYRELFGDRPLGVPLAEAFDDIPDPGNIPLYDKVLQTGEPVFVPDMTVRMPDPELGVDERTFSFSLSPVELDQGECGVLSVGVETTEQTVVQDHVREISEERLRLLRRYSSLVKVGAELVWVAGADGRMLDMSPGWQRMIGGADDIVASQDWSQIVHKEDRAAVVASWAQAVARKDPLWEHVFRIRTATGAFHHFHARAVPVREDGEVIEWVGTLANVEDRWQENRRRTLLERAGAMAGGVSRLKEAVEGLAHVIVPELADTCTFYLLLDAVERPASAPVIADRIAGAVREGLPPAPIGVGHELFQPSGPFARTVRTAEPVHVPNPPGLPSGIMRTTTEEWVASTHMHDVVMLPLVVDGSVAAVVTVGVCPPRPALGPSDVRLATEILEHAHGPLSNAIRYQRTQRMSLALQSSLLAEPPEVPGLEIAARYRASPAAAEVGGDWYDSFLLPDGALVLTIGDVAGHDLPAAVTMSQLRNMLRSLVVDRCEPPGDILRRLDTAMESLHTAGTASCVLARVECAPDGWRLNYAAAGHPPPLLITADGKGRYLEAGHSPLLGIGLDIARPSAIEPLESGGTLLLYTDGLVERPGEHLDDGLLRLCEHASLLAREPIEVFCEELVAGLPTTGKDDIAVIALRLPGDAEDVVSVPSSGDG
ncbi:SpoIIE family protein phosphatase [Spongiactinospora sp. TRM90649]|uniref:SpoIIE family protein phosphatase n=1 Tax=Spongiactinospora sp. TRM90649 TaxID=3031114 RepID=UPI0023F9E770|nr:SpoIIE family protein phosphatase [Spongiactinospora sp. TRM90649]MDF5752905.1 SpoIIE family protein phosphatase [Spongiactinospora sp. TRM90649]